MSDPAIRSTYYDLYQDEICHGASSTIICPVLPCITLLRMCRTAVRVSSLQQQDLPKPTTAGAATKTLLRIKCISSDNQDL